MAYVIWREEPICDVSVLRRVQLSKLVTVGDRWNRQLILFGDGL